MKKKVLSIIGKLLSIVCLIFIIKVILRFNIDFSILLEKKVLISILGCSLLFSNSVLMNSIAWKKLLNIFTTQRLNTLEIVDIYANANLSKYLPGNIMHYASRNLYGAKYGIEQKYMVYSTIMEILLKIVAASIISLLFLNQKIIEILNAVDQKLYINSRYIIMAIIVVIILVILMIIWRFTKNRVSVIINLTKSIFLYSIIFLINAFIFIMITYAVGVNIGYEEILYATGIYIIAWLIGYLTPGAPGGVGIKEGIIIMMLSNVYTVEAITVISLITRIVTIIADIIAYLANKVIQIKKEKTPNLD